MKDLEDHYFDALQELQVMTLKQIQVDTAYKWAGRALAAVNLGRGHDAIEYAHEALEHAALSGKDSVLREIRDALTQAGVEP